MNVIHPSNVSFSEWAIAFVSDNGIALEPPRDTRDWREWVSRLIDILDAPAIPSPEEFNTWIDWAQAALPQLEEIE